MEDPGIQYCILCTLYSTYTVPTLYTVYSTVPGIYVLQMLIVSGSSISVLKPFSIDPQLFYLYAQYTVSTVCTLSHDTVHCTVQCVSTVKDYQNCIFQQSLLQYSTKNVNILYSIQYVCIVYDYFMTILRQSKKLHRLTYYTKKD